MGVFQVGESAGARERERMVPSRVKGMILRLTGVLALGLLLGAAASPAAGAAGITGSGATAGFGGQSRDLLPADFGSWKRGSVQPVSPAQQDAAAWKEFGFTRGEQAQYAQRGRTLAVEVFQFPDATGAYGAFTMLRTVRMRPVRIDGKLIRNAPAPRQKGLPDLTSWNGVRQADAWLFWKGGLLVEAKFSPGVSGQERAIAELDDALPGASGPAAVPPTLPNHLPADGLDPSSVRYAIGPAAYAQEGGVLPPELIHFYQDAEAVTAQYGKGTLTLLSYPTPEIADARMAALAGALQQGAVQGIPGALLVKRAGTRVAVTSGGFTAAQAKALLAQVQFREHIAIDRLKPKVSEIAKTAQLLTSIALLTILLGGASILLGLFLGGGRALYRVMRGKPASSLYDEEFIALKLNEK